MIRKLAVALALALLLVTVSIRLNALGLGEIEIESALNQPMKAEISLTSVAGTDISQIKIELASREEHQRLGLSRSKILSNLKFEVITDARGQAMINVSSTEPVREPYLEFLLEMSWENGRMVREYTVLIDPPVTMPAAPLAPVAAVVQAPAVTPARIEPVARPAPAPRPATTTFSPSPVQRKTANTYGAVRREEALWSISERLRPDSDISVQQMMIALLRANPEAFPDNNINNLKAGSTLTIPDRDAILALTQAEARAEAGRQYLEWRRSRQAAKPAVENKPVAETRPVVEAPAAVVPVVASVAIEETEAHLKLTPPEGDPVAGSASDSDGGVPGAEASGDDSIRRRLALASEEIEAGKARSAELQSRVQELEATIRRMERLLELKSDPLASLQNNAGSQVAEASPVGEDVAAEAVQSTAASENEAMAVAGEGDATADDPASVDAEKADATGESAPEEPGIVSRLMENPVLAGLGALVVILLGGFLWKSLRQRSSRAMHEDEPTLGMRPADSHSSESVLDEAAPSVRDPGTYEEDPVAGFEATSETANDPVTEADVYLAYGRVHQAEDVLQLALKDDPTNIQVRAKLLEVFHAAGNVAAFNIAASEYRELTSADDEQWSRIAKMGYELSPGSELYSAATHQVADAGNEIDFDMDLSGMDEMASQSTMNSDVDDLALTMDAETMEPGEQPESFAFSLDDIDEDGSQGEGLLASSDEVATKLDLARAYIDMEDPEGARSILREVLDEGSAEQKSEAESLISKIG